MRPQLTKHGDPTGVANDRLLEACQQGDPDAWETIIDRYERLVFAIAVREGLSPEDAADATQAVFEAFLQGMSRITSGESVGAWLACVARRHAWRQRDRRSREKKAFEREARLRVLDVDLEIHVIEDRASELYESLMALGEPCRSILTALYFDPSKPSYIDIAHATGRPVGSIGPTRARCLQRLRSLLSFSEAS